MIPGPVKFAALLPATDLGTRNAVSALPACVVPPTAVSFNARSAATPAGATMSIIAGNVVLPDENARSESGPTAMLMYRVAVKFASALAAADGNVVDPPDADAYTSTAPAPALKTRIENCVPGSLKSSLRMCSLA